jgi:hypothetical protein
MGPGPWALATEVRLPPGLHPTSRNRRANVLVSHVLKIVMRVERGDDTHIDLKTGRRKLFEIVVHAPVHLLSVRRPPCPLLARGDADCPAAARGPEVHVAAALLRDGAGRARPRATIAAAVGAAHASARAHAARG